jgi:hypothetical protein
MTQGYTQLIFSASAETTSTLPPPQMLARLTTRGNQPITVNGVSATTGDSIATDAVIETPPGVTATIDLGPLGSLDIEPGTRLKLEYDSNCIPPTPGDTSQDPDKKCRVRVTVFAGCATAHYKRGSHHEAVNEQGVVIQESDKKRKGAGAFPFCAGAPAGAAAAGGGLTTLTKVLIGALIIGGGGIIWTILDNPSNSST